MCVILIADNRRLTLSVLKQAHTANNQGAGIAWIEEGAVRWRKGESVETIADIASDVPMPYVVHFRIASVGGVRPALCHPFPVELRANGNAVAGKSKTVLFHNGHWASWQENLLRAVTAGTMKLPGGEWSDSRAMAWLAARYGRETLELIPRTQRMALVSKSGVKMYGDGWTAFAKGQWASNLNWQRGQGFTPGLVRRDTCEVVAATSQTPLRFSQADVEHQRMLDRALDRSGMDEDMRVRQLFADEDALRDLE